MTPILGMIFTMIADAIEYGQGIGSALISFIMKANGYNGNLATQSPQAISTRVISYFFGSRIAM